MIRTFVSKKYIKKNIFKKIVIGANLIIKLIKEKVESIPFFKKREMKLY